VSRAHRPAFHHAPALLGALVLVGAFGATIATAEDVGEVHVEVKEGPKPATLTARLHRPAGAGPFPAVVFMHGCRGIGERQHALATELAQEGYVVLVVDSFGVRGIERMCASTDALPADIRAADVFAAVRNLHARRDVDRTRIGVVGWSHGGSTTLWAMTYQSDHPGEPLAAAIAFYPGCADAPGWDAGPPLLMLLAEKDNWALPSRCLHLADRMRAGDRSVQTIVYPDAQHGFDDVSLKRPLLVRDALRGRGATMAYDPEAHADARRQVREFLAQHLKGTLR
jgi:dienelactone hydrolase